MWKTLFYFRAATPFYPQAKCEKEQLFHRLFWKDFQARFSTVQLVLFPQALWKTKSQ